MPSASDLLKNVISSLPSGGEVRHGQQEMAEAVAEAVSGQSTLVVEAGTGTGKSLAYLTPVISAGARTVVATATIALQSQLLEHDIVHVARGLNRPISAKLLKGRRNYLCRQALGELLRAKQSEQLELLGGHSPSAALNSLVQWAEQTETGDRDELETTPPPDVWNAVSVGADDCPGANRCPSGDECLAEQARQQAHEADVIVTNHHYYGIHLASGGVIIPDHDVVVFDEAHQLIDTLGSTCGTEIGGRRLHALARRWRGVSTDQETSTALERSGHRIDDQLRSHRGQRLELSTELVAQLVAARERADKTLGELRRLKPPEGGDAAARIERTVGVATHLIDDIDSVIEPSETDVLWVDGSDAHPILRRTPLDVSTVLDENLWSQRAVVLTSATLADNAGVRLGLEPGHKILRVESPFDYEKQGLLYCPVDLPDPRHGEHRAAVHDELEALAKAAGGRTLALFTSYSAMNAAAEALHDRLSGPILVQGDAPRDALVAKLRSTDKAVLMATMSFWQGIDIAGDDLILVTVDRIPFPRPDEPVTQALRDQAGPDAFRFIDLPRAQTLLAQAAGRLIRRTDDRGVVAILDPRLAKSKAYRWDLINALPPLRRTRNRDDATALLSTLDNEARQKSQQDDR